ncbi:exonuclease V [Aspergillus filifer]
MSCLLKQPLDDNSSDYGSEFSADETDLLNKLLAEVDAPVPAPAPAPPVSATSPPPQQKYHHQQQYYISPTRKDRVPAFVRIPAPLPVPAPVSPLEPGAAVTDIEDLGQDVPDRTPRVLGRERKAPVWQVQKAGGALSDAADHQMGWVPIGILGGAAVEHPDSTEGRERQRERDIAREQERIKAESEGGDSKERAMTDERTPVERFRRPPNKAFSVTDLVSPSWCEVQYWYTLTKHGRKKRTAAMKKGSTIHKTLEDEIYTTVHVEITTKEDALALRIWNIIQGLRTLREFGITREMEVWGLIDGELVNGIIDQLSYECPDSKLEASAASHYAEIAASRAVMPEYQMSLTDYLLSAGGGKRLDEFSTYEVDAEAVEDPVSSQSSTELQHIPRIYMTDIKTKGSSGTPTVKSSSFRPTLLQLQLYYHMLNRMVLSDDVTIDTLASRYGLDAKKPFTDAFITEVGSLNDRFFDALSSLEFDPDYILTPEDALTQGHHSSGTSHDTFSQSSSSSDDTNAPPPASQDSTSILLAHSNLTRLWSLMKDQIRLTFLPQTLQNTSVAPSIPSEFQPNMLEAYPTILSPLLTAKYISSAATADLQPKVLGSRSFLFDPTSLDSYVEDQMSWWRGQRTPRGVEVMEAWKCRICEFKDECEWRQEREWDYARRKGWEPV